jgi:hypothetical protein
MRRLYARKYRARPGGAEQNRALAKAGYYRARARRAEAAKTAAGAAKAAEAAVES